MNKIKIFIEEKYKVIVCIFFIVFLIIGISIFTDYSLGIDELTLRGNGLKSVAYILKGDRGLFESNIRYYGPVFEIVLVAIEKIFNLTRNLRAVFLMRHLVIFLLFYTSVFFFYKLCKRRFNSWKLGLLGSLFLILSPRIFADSFYNSTDIPFLSMFIISMYTLIQYLNKKTLLRTITHAIVCAILIDIRIVGIIVPFFTLIFIVADMLFKKSKWEENRSVITNFGIYIFIMGSLVILFWPALWENPIREFINSFRLLSRYPWQSSSLYLGNYIEGAPPWHYILVWIFISTPILYSVCFFIGCSVTLKELFKNFKRFYINRSESILFGLWFFSPLVIVILFKSVLYCAWRHMFFIYPAFLIFALEGLSFLFRFVKRKFKGSGFKVLDSLLVLIVTFSLINTTYFMVKYHPYQNVYFNILAGKNMSEVKDNFELDYWGLSYKEALEYILKNDKDRFIKIYTTTTPGRPIFSAVLLRPGERNRLVYTKEVSEAKYFLSNYRLHKDEFHFANEYYSVKIGGAKIMVVYKLK